MGLLGSLFGESKKIDFNNLDQIELSRLALIENRIRANDYEDLITSDDIVVLNLGCSHLSIVSCFCLALINLYGMHQNRNIQKAEELLLNIVKANHVISGKAYLYLFVIEEDKGNIKKGIDYLQKGHEAGDPYSSAELGYFYVTGTGLPKNLRKAKELYMFAAKYNIPGMQENIARINAIL